ncbi:MAG: carotenoid oxygenase family protein [Deltaproteobacteria bacterium]|nr:carotenoid oxygenase family protein [Deltaproteobacteria bacterium]
MPALRPYLDGNWAPVLDELVVEDLAIHGSLPPELSGTFLRIGPNPRFAAPGRYHWFDGDGMVHAVTLDGGRAAYRNRFVRTRGLEIEERAGHAIWNGVMEPPQADLPPQSEFIRIKKNVANTACVFHAGRLLALWDTGEPYELDPVTLATRGPYTFGGRLPFPVASHSKVDPITSELIMLGGSMKRPAVQHAVVGPDGALGPVTTVALPRTVWMHDFAITESSSIFFDLPARFEPRRIAEGASPYRFDPTLPSRYGVMPRHGSAGDVQWFEGPPCFIVHTMNAYDAGDEIVLVGVRAEDAEVGFGDSGPTYRSTTLLHEWRFNRRTGAVRERQLDNQRIEFAKIDPRRVGRPNRFGYAGRLAERPPYESDGRIYMMDGICKYDLVEHTVRFHAFGDQCFGGDPEFVPRPGATAEDDGWLLVLVHDEARGVSSLRVCDARDPAAPPMATIAMPRRVPYGVHSTWLSERDLTSATPPVTPSA